MPKLYIKQKVFSWKDKFSVYNAFGEDVYRVEGELGHVGDNEGGYVLTQAK